MAKFKIGDIVISRTKQTIYEIVGFENFSNVQFYDVKIINSPIKSAIGYRVWGLIDKVDEVYTLYKSSGKQNHPLTKIFL